RYGHNRRACFDRQPGHARSQFAHRRLFGSLTFGKDAQSVPTFEHARSLAERRLAMAFADVDGERAYGFYDLPKYGNLEERLPRHKEDRALDRQPHQQWVQVGRMVARDDYRSVFGHVFHAVVFDGKENAKQRVGDEFNYREEH